MANITGNITIDEVDILEVDADPSLGTGAAASMGSLALWNDGVTGHIFLKTGTANTAWTQVFAVNTSKSIFKDDDFITFRATGSGLVGELAWDLTISGTGSTVAQTNTNVDSNHPGNVTLTTGSSSGRSAAILWGATVPSIVLGGGPINFEFLIRLPSLITGTVRVGMGDSATADFTNGVYFQYTQGTSVNWLIKTAKASTRTTTTTTTAVVANAWIKLGIAINAAGTSAQYFINGTSVGTIATNLPTAPVGFVFHVVSAGNADAAVIDYFTFYQLLTTPR